MNRADELADGAAEQPAGWAGRSRLSLDAWLRVAIWVVAAIFLVVSLVGLIGGDGMAGMHHG